MGKTSNNMVGYFSNIEIDVLLKGSDPGEGLGGGTEAPRTSGLLR